MRPETTFGRTTLAHWMMTLAFAVAAAGTTQAQFNGPALSVTPDTNAPQKPTTDTSLLLPSQRDPLLNPGDLLTVRIFGQTDYAPPVRVSVDGTVQLPLIGPVKIAGLTTTRAADLIASRLASAGMFVNPQVSIQVTETATQFVTVLGEMHAIVPISGDRKLFDVLAAAGPLPDRASHVITILREGVDPIIVDLGTDPARSAKADITVLPGDKVLISKVGVVYVLGAFKTQGAIPLMQNSPLTLMQATALSGGIGFEGRYKDLRIVRTEGLKRTVVKLDVKRVVDGPRSRSGAARRRYRLPTLQQPQGGDQVGRHRYGHQYCFAPDHRTTGAVVPGVIVKEGLQQMHFEKATDSAASPHPVGCARRVRLAYLVSHPIQYQSPMLRRIAQDPEIDLTVFFGSDFSIRGYRDKDFGVEVKWDVPLLEGFKSEMLPVVRDNGSEGVFSPISRGIVRRLRGFDALWVHGYATVNQMHGIPRGECARDSGPGAVGFAVEGSSARCIEGWAVKTAFFALLRNLVDGVLVSGTLNRNYWTHYMGEGFPLFLLPYAVDNEWFQQQCKLAAATRGELQIELGIETGRPVILFASKLQTRQALQRSGGGVCTLSRPDCRAAVSPDCGRRRGARGAGAAGGGTRVDGGSLLRISQPERDAALSGACRRVRTAGAARALGIDRE